MKPCRYSEALDYKFSKRCSLDFKDKLGGGFNVAWTADVVSINGAHYHFWIPKNTTDLKKFKDDCAYHASYQGDPVSFSWSYVPENVACPSCGNHDTQISREYRICNKCGKKWKVE